MDDNVMKLIDTHAHIDVDRFDEDRDQVVARAREAGLVAIVNMGDTMESSLRSVKLTQQYDLLYAGVGIHPEEANSKSYMHLNVHSSTIYKSQDMGAT